MFINNINIPKIVNDNFTITNIKVNEYGYTLTIKKYFRSYIIYTNELFKIGDIINVKGDVVEFKYYLTPHSFNLNNYYKTIGIYGNITNSEIIDTNNFNYLYYFSNIVKNDYLKTFLGTNMLNDNLNESISDLNIYYLISLSGIHISFLILIIKKIMFHLNTSTKKQNNIILTTYFIILVISNYKVVIIRIFIYQLLIYIKYRKEIVITNYSLLQLSFLILILFKPYLMMNKSLLISYLLVNSIYLFSPLIDSNNYIIRQIKTNILSSIVLIPFITKVNVLTILLSPIYFFLIINIAFPLSLLTIINNGYILNKLLDNIFNIINLSNKLNLTFKFYKLNYFYILIYYITIILIIILKNQKKYYLILILLLTLNLPSYKRHFKTSSMYFLDTGQGDSSVYISKESVVVIDCYYNVLDFLEGEGIKEIDYLILTHSHYDHIREANTLIKEMNVKNIYISGYDNEYDLITKKTYKITNYYEIVEKDFKIIFYSPFKNFNHTNNNSLVFKFIYNNISILFTGDIELNAEYEILKKYREKLKSDILKVAHHGSNTSTNIDILKMIKPKVAIISAGRDNSYKFPNNEVIKRLKDENVVIYLTSINGTIKVSNINQIKLYLDYEN